jgi:hypothetical protein
VAQSGDSGGPVYNYVADGRVDVRGFIDAIDPSFSTAGCSYMNPNYRGGVYPGVPSSRAFAVNVVNAFAAVGAIARVG